MRQAKNMPSMDFHIVILNEYLPLYPNIDWIAWKDQLSEKMSSQGDNWLKATLTGKNIWHCLESNKINTLHLVAWKPVDETLYKVSLPENKLSST